MMIAFDILKLDRLTDAQLFEFCMAVGADQIQIIEHR